MPLLPIAIEPPPTTVSSTVELVVSRDEPTASTAAMTVNYVFQQPEDDPFVESPMVFVPGVEADPDRESDDEPVGTGPFGF